MYDPDHLPEISVSIFQPGKSETLGSIRILNEVFIINSLLENRVIRTAKSARVG
jgi:hypothetical protein